MPDDLAGWPDRGTFAEKTMECKLKQTDDTDMCLSVISMIVGKYISQMETSSDRVEISVLRPHRAGSGKKIYSRYVDGEKLSEDDVEWIAADFGTDRDRVKETMEQMEKDFAYEALTCWPEGHEL